MRKFIPTLTALLIVVLAAGTFIEHANGHETAAAMVYHAPWFIALWGLLAGLGIAAIIKWKLWNRFWVFLLHLSLLLILFGALLSHLTARQGTLHIRQGETAARYFPDDTDQVSPLPFALRLDTFIVSYTTGTGAPRDFESRVSIIEAHPIPPIKEGSTQATDTALTTPHDGAEVEGSPSTIRMNQPLSLKGYRFYQASYDPDHRGTVLTVAYDPYGLPLTYAAYMLLGLSMLALLLRHLMRKEN